MARKIRPEELSEEQLQALLHKKRLRARQQRMETFRRTGRIVALAATQDAHSLDELTIGSLEPSGEMQGGAPPSRRKRVTDRLLLAVEVLAILGLIFVVFNGVNLVRTLNEEVSASMVQPTLTPTPLISAVVLPSGHTFNEQGMAEFNVNEIPEHLRPMVQAQANVPVPTPSPEQANWIKIPAIGVDAPVVQGDGWEQLKSGVGQHIGTANPGENGNMVLSAHNDIFGEIFRHLDKLQPGDEVTVFTNVRAYTYVIGETLIVDPLFVQVMEPTRDPTLTLISCYPYLINNQRIVVKATLIDNLSSGAVPQSNGN